MKEIDTMNKHFFKNSSFCEIIVPFEGAEQEAELWAESEKGIDFRENPFEASRSTASFAACELKNFLKKIIPNLRLSIGSQLGGSDFSISLKIEDNSSERADYRIKNGARSLEITGSGRIGALYGVYHLLKLQGYHWYAPGDKGEIIPAKRDFLLLPETEINEKPSFDILRGFDFEKHSMESAELLLWMARNRLNLAGPRPQTLPLARKLGMRLKTGGHIFEGILNPDRPLPSGKTIWEEHPDWYGMPENGKRLKEEALQTQFCISAPGLLDYLGDELVKTIKSEWSDTDYVDIWGFDTWGSVCCCEGCVELGNGSDRNMFFLAAMRRSVNRAVEQGILRHKTKLIGCSYEGTSTIEALTKPVPEELIEAGDIATYYPINRCYKHDMSDSSCCDNRRYNGHLEDWAEAKGGFEIMIGEYYNVSKFEDLPLLFSDRIKADIPHYHELGARACTYMHIPMLCWGVRRLNQLLYGELLWNIDADVERIIATYFEKTYGKHASKIKDAYKKLETAWLHIQQWRSWSGKSILSQLKEWNGQKPSKALSLDHHFSDIDSLISDGLESVELMKKAFNIFTECLKEEKSLLTPPLDQEQAVNPIQLALQNKQSSALFFIEEDRRIVKYGLEVMSLMTKTVQFHEAWRKNEIEESEKHWRRIAELADSMSLQYMPIRYANHAPGISCPDVLTRSQLKQPLERCEYFYKKTTQL